MPIDLTTLLAFGLASIAVYIAPGVDMVYIASNSISHGLRAGAAAASGVVSGVMVQAVAAASGVSAIFLISPVLFEAVRWVGVAYLCYLGYKLLRSGADPDIAGQGTSWRFWPVLLKGITINLLNPKIALFFLAFLPQFADPQRGSLFVQLAILGLLFSAGAVVWCFFQAWAFSRIGGWLTGQPRALAWQTRISGGALLVFAGLLAFTGARR